MSSNYPSSSIFAMHGYGMYLDKHELSDMLAKMSQGCGKRIAAGDLYEWDATPLDHRHLTWWNIGDLPDKEDGYDLPGAFLFAEKSGSIFDGTGATYRTPDELADEMRERFGAYLPDGFDYATHFASMLGCRSSRMHD